MPTDFTVTDEFPAPAAQVYARITDRDFLQERMVAGGGVDPKVISVETVDGATTIVTQQSIPASALPSMVANMLGGDPVTERTEVWRADGDAFTAELSLTVKGAPASMKGTTRLQDSGSGSTLATTATATVPIPMFGAKLESVIAEQLTTVLTTEAEYTRSHLA